MELYRKLYFKLFGRVADAVEALDAALPDGGTPDLLGVFRARDALVAAMRELEDAYLAAESDQ